MSKRFTIDTPNAIGILCRESSGDICLKGYTFRDLAELCAINQYGEISREAVANFLCGMALSIHDGEYVILPRIQPKGRDQFMTSGKMLEWDEAEMKAAVARTSRRRQQDLDTNLNGGR